MTNVKCNVRSCHYWGNGNVCTADTITVDNNVSETGTFGMETGDLYLGIEDHEDHELHQSHHSGDLARTSDQTLCRTFRPKDSHGSR